MKSIIFTALFLLVSSHTLLAQGSTPVFSASDKLNEFGEWRTQEYATVRGEKDQIIPISYRIKVIKKFALTCKYEIEIRNDSKKEIKFFYLAGNNRTNYFAGTVGTIKEKVKLGPGEIESIDYPLPTKNFKPLDEADECKRCKELDHSVFFGDLEAK